MPTENNGEEGGAREHSMYLKPHCPHGPHDQRSDALHLIQEPELMTLPLHSSMVQICSLLPPVAGLGITRM